MSPEGAPKKKITEESAPKPPENLAPADDIDELQMVRDGLQLKRVLSGLDKNKPNDKSFGVESEG